MPRRRTSSDVDAGQLHLRVEKLEENFAHADIFRKTRIGEAHQAENQKLQEELSSLSKKIEDRTVDDDRKKMLDDITKDLEKTQKQAAQADRSVATATQRIRELEHGLQKNENQSNKLSETMREIQESFEVQSEVTEEHPIINDLRKQQERLTQTQAQTGACIADLKQHQQAITEDTCILQQNTANLRFQITELREMAKELRQDCDAEVPPANVTTYIDQKTKHSTEAVREHLSQKLKESSTKMREELQQYSKEFHKNINEAANQLQNSMNVAHRTEEILRVEIEERITTAQQKLEANIQKVSEQTRRELGAEVKECVGEVRELANEALRQTQQNKDAAERVTTLETEVKTITGKVVQALQHNTKLTEACVFYLGLDILTFNCKSFRREFY